MENPRQFASLDASDIGLHGSLTNRPASGTIADTPLDFAKHFDIERQVIEYQKQNGTYQPRSSDAELAHQQELKQARDAAWRQSVKESKAAQEIQAAHEQAERTKLFNRIKGEQGTPNPLADESDRNRIRRMNGAAPIDEPPISSMPQRQPLPSTGSPPPTSSGTAARASALVEPTATPAPAALKEAIATGTGNAISALPRALPQAAGRLVIPGVGAALSLGTRLVVGQSLVQAVTSTGAGLIGTGIGAIVGTAIGGPIGGVVGGMVGGTAASLFSDWLFAQNVPSTAAHLESFTPNYPPFIGGQGVGALYSVRCTWKTTFNGQPGDNQVMNADVYGPISEIHLENDPPDGAPGCRIVARNADGSGLNRIQGSGFSPATKPYGLQVTVTYVSGGTRDQYIDQSVPSPPRDNSPYRYDSSPVGNDNVIPSGKPAVGKSKPESRDIAPSMPSNNVPNGARGFVGHGGLAPSYLPNPAHQDMGLPGLLPMLQPLPQKQSLPFAEPEDIPVPRAIERIGLTITPSTGGLVPIGYGEVTLSALTPSTVTVSEGTDALGNDVSTRDKNTFFTAVPSPTPQYARPIPMSDALSPVPKSKSFPITKTPTELANADIKTALDQQKKDFDDQIGRMTAIATAIAALTPAIQNIPNAIANNPNVRAANRETTQGAVCEIAQPGGCLGNALDDSANKVNQNNNQNTANLLDKINAGANAAQLALLELMNTKLGDLIPGGLSGKLQRLSKWMHLDRALNILIWWQTLHNAYMLSANLGQTLTSAISNVLAAIGIKDAEGSPLDIGEVLGHQFDSLAKSVIGESEWGGIKAEYKKWNRIYQAAANLKNSIESIGYSILSALEVVGSWVASIGNALRNWGEVGDKAYKYMNPTPNFQNKFFTALENTENVVSQIDSVASEVLSVQETAAQIGEQKSIIEKALKEDDSSKQGTAPPEATKVKGAAEEAKAKSTSPQIPQISSETDKEADE
ncbi:MAG: hypothetical protein V7L09_33540 [Nostoc sp.]|uniref:hypothetical protein n=1 Tax=Nostoc sp. TaxID=1180 RepID=UPI002FF40602